MSDENEISYEQEQLPAETQEDVSEREPPQYDPGAPAEEEKKEPIENAGFRRRAERQHKRADNREIQQLRQQLEDQQRAFMELRQSLQPTETPPQSEIEARNAAKKLIQESFHEYLLEGEETKRRYEYQKREEEEYLRQQEEAEINQDCIERINAGAKRYRDFNETISNAGVTFSDEMAMAVRRFEDPAAFLYNASKYHKEELMDISRIRDPIEQAWAMKEINDRIMSRITPNRQSNAPSPMMPNRTLSPRESLYTSNEDDFSPGAIYARRHAGKIYRD